MAGAKLCSRGAEVHIASAGAQGTCCVAGSPGNKEGNCFATLIANVHLTQAIARAILPPLPGRARDQNLRLTKVLGKWNASSYRVWTETLDGASLVTTIDVVA